MAVFNSFDILLPKAEFMPLWPVVACDQFTSQPEYWQALREKVGASPSALNCILPEVELKGCTEERYGLIRENMKGYLDSGIFREFDKSFVYVERTLLDGSVRAGLVGVIDLEDYDFHADAVSAIRATERTVEERIPPRMKVRRGAGMELSHVLLLCDDEQELLIEPLKNETDKFEKVYDQQLLMDGGHIRGYIINGARAKELEKAIEAYCARKAEQYGEAAPMLFAVGDGNHSLATAKACYEELKNSGAEAEKLVRARYAMVELENIRDDVQKFEPIHRLLTDVEPEAVLEYLENNCGAAEGHAICWMAGGKQGTIHLDREKGLLPVAVLQTALDKYLEANAGSIDYIHGMDALEQLSAKPASIGFALEAVPKGDFFRGIAKDGVLPRKTFSMGEAQEKRYYLEARKL